MASAKGIRTVLLGPPGSGKGTQSENMKKEYCVCHLATGDMLRAEVAAGTEIGKRAKSIMDSGKFVDDDTIIEMIRGNLRKDECSKGFILDGFPRNVTQAEKLDGMLTEDNAKLDAVLEFKVNPDLLVRRIVGRLVHPASGRSYHTEFRPPVKPMTDDVTGEPLIRRSDDNAETLAKRLSTYFEKTQPLVDFYKTQGILRTIDASASPTKVWASIKSIFA